MEKKLQEGRLETGAKLVMPNRAEDTKELIHSAEGKVDYLPEPNRTYNVADPRAPISDSRLPGHSRTEVEEPGRSRGRHQPDSLFSSAQDVTGSAAEPQPIPQLSALTEALTDQNASIDSLLRNLADQAFIRPLDISNSYWNLWENKLLLEAESLAIEQKESLCNRLSSPEIGALRWILANEPLPQQSKNDLLDTHLLGEQIRTQLDLLMRSYGLQVSIPEKPSAENLATARTNLASFVDDYNSKVEFGSVIVTKDDCQVTSAKNDPYHTTNKATDPPFSGLNSKLAGQLGPVNASDLVTQKIFTYTTFGLTRLIPPSLREVCEPEDIVRYSSRKLANYVQQDSRRALVVANTGLFNLAAEELLDSNRRDLPNTNGSLGWGEAKVIDQYFTICPLPEGAVEVVATQETCFSSKLDEENNLVPLNPGLSRLKLTCKINIPQSGDPTFTEVKAEFSAVPLHASDKVDQDFKESMLASHYHSTPLPLKPVTFVSYGDNLGDLDRTHEIQENLANYWQNTENTYDDNLFQQWLAEQGDDIKGLLPKGSSALPSFADRILATLPYSLALVRSANKLMLAYQNDNDFDPRKADELKTMADSLRKEISLLNAGLETTFLKTDNSAGNQDEFNEANRKTALQISTMRAMLSTTATLVGKLELQSIPFQREGKSKMNKLDRAKLQCRFCVQAYEKLFNECLHQRTQGASKSDSVLEALGNMIKVARKRETQILKYAQKVERGEIDLVDFGEGVKDKKEEKSLADAVRAKNLTTKFLVKETEDGTPFTSPPLDELQLSRIAYGRILREILLRDALTKTTGSQSAPLKEFDLQYQKALDEIRCQGWQPIVSNFPDEVNGKHVQVTSEITAVTDPQSKKATLADNRIQGLTPALAHTSASVTSQDAAGAKLAFSGLRHGIVDAYEISKFGEVRLLVSNERKQLLADTASTRKFLLREKRFGSLARVSASLIGEERFYFRTAAGRNILRKAANLNMAKQLVVEVVNNNPHLLKQADQNSGVIDLEIDSISLVTPDYIRKHLNFLKEKGHHSERKHLQEQTEVFRLLSKCQLRMVLPSAQDNRIPQEVEIPPDVASEIPLEAAGEVPLEIDVEVRSKPDDEVRSKPDKPVQQDNQKWVFQNRAAGRDTQSVIIRPKIKSFNFAVNKYAHASQGIKKLAKPFTGWRTSDKMNTAGLDSLVGRVAIETPFFGDHRPNINCGETAKVIKYLRVKNSMPAVSEEEKGEAARLLAKYPKQKASITKMMEVGDLTEIQKANIDAAIERFPHLADVDLYLHTLDTLQRQIRNIYLAEEHHSAGSEPYKLPARLALLSCLLGHTPIFNCKSGLGRTCGLDAAIKQLAVSASQGYVPEPETDQDSIRKTKYAISTGSSEFQKYHRSYAGYKPSEAKIILGSERTEAAMKALKQGKPDDGNANQNPIQAPLASQVAPSSSVNNLNATDL